MPQNADPMLGLYRNAIKPFSDLLTAALTGVERLQQTQLSAIQELLAHQSSMDRQLLDASSLHEAMDIQSQSSREAWTKAITAFSEFHAAGGINQMAWIGHAQSRALDTIDDIERSLEDLPQEMVPLTNAVKLAIAASRAIFSANIRATEEAAKLANTRLENVLSEAPMVSSKRQAA